MYKRLLLPIFIFIISIISYGAIISDNDGSAFVTKAEFDSLKKNFNKQIDDYNSSIDGKIDGAIASYLSGIKLSTEAEQKIGESILDWPVTFCDVPLFDFVNHYGGTVKWRPLYYFPIFFNRRYMRLFYVLDDTATINPWRTFYNYNSTPTIGSTKYALIDSSLENYKAIYKATHWISRFSQNHGVVVNYNSYVVSGVTDAYTMASGDGAYSTGRTYELVADGTQYATAGVNKLTFNYALTYNTAAAGQTIAVTTSSGKYYKKWTASSGGWQVATGPYNVDPSWAITYDKSKLKNVYNKSAIKVPVAKNGQVVLSNYHNAGVALESSKGHTATSMLADGTALTWTVREFQAPNYTVLDVDHCNKTDMFDTAFIDSDRLCYEVKDTADGTSFYQIMTQGVYLFTMNYNKGDAFIMLNSWMGTGATPKVMFRKEPFEDDDINSSKNLLLTTAGDKYADLQSNMKITLTGIEKGDKIFMKIVDTAASGVILQEPEIIVSFYD